MNNTAEKKNVSSKGKAILVVLILAVIGLAIFSFSLYNEKRRNTEELTQQKAEIMKDLQVMKSDYDVALEKEKGANKELLQARDIITKYIDSLSSAKADISMLWKYKNQVQILKTERKRLLAENDSLIRHNKLITQERDSTMQVLEERVEYADSLAQQNSKLAEVVEKGAALQLKSLEAEAVKERSNGRLVSTRRSRSADKIRVCFTVASNRMAKSGSSHLYIQVLSPYQISLGENELLTKGDITINYSVVSEFIYEKVDLDVCEFVDKPNGQNRFDSGEYLVKVYNENLDLIGETKFDLK